MFLLEQFLGSARALPSTDVRRRSADRAKAVVLQQ